MSTPFLLGVNYWPRRKAMYWWQNFDADEVREEFDIIASIGMNVVRLFLLWDDWQPTPDSVSAERLRDFGIVCDIAAERNLQLDVTFFTGHMSGPNWSPQWLLDKNAPPHGYPYVRQVVSGGKVVDSAYRNMFHDEDAIRAARLLLKTVVTEYHQHDAIWMWNLGNEPDLFAHPHSAQAGRDWVKDMTGVIKSIDSEHLVTCGLHVDSTIKDNGLNIDKVYAETDVAVMHGYPMYAIPWARHELDPDFMPFLCALTTALCGKPTLAEEWGGCTAPQGSDSVVWEWENYGNQRTQFMASEQALADHIETVLPKLQEVGSTGAMLWCFADYAEELWDKPPCDPNGARHERHFGLVRPDGTLKPHADVIRKFAETNPIVTEATRTVTLDITPDEYYQDPMQHAYRLYKEYLARYEE